MANELITWRHQPQDRRPETYPGRTDVPSVQLNDHKTFRVYVGVPAVDANEEITRYPRTAKLGRLTVNDQVQPEPILGDTVEIDGNQPELPGAKYEITETTLRPDWPSLEK